VSYDDPGEYGATQAASGLWCWYWLGPGGAHMQSVAEFPTEDAALEAAGPAVAAHLPD
jgi:hypothetical protein